MIPHQYTVCIIIHSRPGSRISNRAEFLFTKRYTIPPLFFIYLFFFFKYFCQFLIFRDSSPSFQRSTLVPPYTHETKVVVEDIYCYIGIYILTLAIYCYIGSGNKLLHWQMVKIRNPPPPGTPSLYAQMQEKMNGPKLDRMSFFKKL